MKSKYFLIIFSGLLLVSVLIGSSYIFSENATGSKYEVQNSSSRVTVSIQPVKVTNTVIEFNLILDTHSYPLNKLDLKNIITLRTGDNEIKPVEVPKYSGHHGSGKLVFELKKPLNKIVLTIKDVPNIPERVFKWDK